MLAAGGGGWKVVLPRTRLGPGAQHLFTLAANEINNVSKLILLPLRFT